MSMDQLEPAQIKKVDGGVLVAGFEDHPGRDEADLALCAVRPWAINISPGLKL